MNNQYLKISGKILDQSDIGRKVVYTPKYREMEEGVLSSFDVERQIIFVKFKGPNGERCSSNSLSWIGE